MKTTINEGLPYALPTDSMLEPAQLQAFLQAQDTKFPAWDASFTATAKAPGFSAHASVDGSTINQNNISLPTFDVTDYDHGINGNSSGWGGSSTWALPPNDGPSWWVFGCTMYIVNASGTINANNIIQINIQVTDIDPNSTTGQLVAYNKTGLAEAVDNATSGGQAIQAVTLAHFRNTATSSGQATVFWTFHDATNTGPITKRYKAGSRFWGFRVGSA